jgi:hypothetical protein
LPTPLSRTSSTVKGTQKWTGLQRRRVVAQSCRRVNTST